MQKNRTAHLFPARVYSPSSRQRDRHPFTFGGERGGGGRFQDAQESIVPTMGKRDVEVWLQDIHGQAICIRKRVTISDVVSQPILCYGKITQCGWSMNATNQTLHNNQYNVNIPVELQNCSLTVQGHIRIITEERKVRLMKAHLNDTLTELPHGWQINDKGHMVGYHVSNLFVIPSLYNPNLDQYYRTTFIQSEESHWELVEICELISEDVFEETPCEDGCIRNVIFIMTDYFVTPEDLDFPLEGELPLKVQEQDQIRRRLARERGEDVYRHEVLKT